jgi:hypothetical protein
VVEASVNAVAHRSDGLSMTCQTTIHSEFWRKNRYLSGARRAALCAAANWQASMILGGTRCLLALFYFFLVLTSLFFRSRQP